MDVSEDDANCQNKFKTIVQCFVLFVFFSMGFSDIPYIYIYERMALFGTEKIERNKVLHGTICFFFVTFFPGIDISICIYPSVYVEILWLLLMLLLWLRG